MFPQHPGQGLPHGGLQCDAELMIPTPMSRTHIQTPAWRQPTGPEPEATLRLEAHPPC